jgi:hypothetical protein
MVIKTLALCSDEAAAQCRRRLARRCAAICGEDLLSEGPRRSASAGAPCDMFDQSLKIGDGRILKDVAPAWSAKPAPRASRRIEVEP